VSLGWHDLRRTVRRRGGAAPAQAYPYLLRDERLYPQLALAIDYFESMVGRPRAELDGEVLVQFLADHRLARAVVASLARHYHYRRQGFADALDPETRARLADLGLHGPTDLRAALYADVNRHDGGFAADAARTAAIARLAEHVGLAPDAVEALLILDAEDRAPLVRLGPTPTPAEVAAIHNHLVAEAVLRAAARVELELAAPARGPAAAHTACFVRSLAAHGALAGLRPEAIEAPGLDLASSLDALRAEATKGPGVSLDGSRDGALAAPEWRPASRGRRTAPRQVALLGEQDALGSWTRHGRRLVRALGRALVRHPGVVRGGSVLVEARGGPYTCSLTPEFLHAFAGPTAGDVPSAASGAEAAAETFWDPRPELIVLRRRGEADGWSLRNWPTALVYPEGVLFPEFTLQRGAVAVQVVVVDTPTLAATVARLAPRLAARGDVLLAVIPALAAALHAPDVAVVELPNPPAPFPTREGGAPAPAAPGLVIPEVGTGPETTTVLAVSEGKPSVPAQPAPPFPFAGGRGAGGVRGPSGLGLLLAAASAFAPRTAPATAALDRVLAAVREAGFLPTERALTLAGCADEPELAGRLAAAGVEDVRLVAGMGLHTEAFFRRLHGARAASGAA
jgi:hypothetical protein